MSKKRFGFIGLFTLLVCVFSSQNSFAQSEAGKKLYESAIFQKYLSVFSLFSEKTEKKLENLSFDAQIKY